MGCELVLGQGQGCNAASREVVRTVFDMGGGYLDRLELHNFKSYGGDVVVGPFRSGFNCICGTNGSGKSNAMDAISFVLGVRTSQLRGNQLRDLVYRNSRDPNDDASRRKAHVKLVYITGEKVQIVFHRGVSLSGASEYKVNGKTVTMEAYNSKLASIGVLVKARNFLVFQNEVEGIASKNPKDLTAMFEELSGSAELRDKYEEARAEKETSEENVMHFWRKRKGMAAEKRLYKEQKEEAEKFRALQKQIADTKTSRALFHLFHIEADVKVCEEDLAEEDSLLQDLEKKIEGKESALAEEKAEIAALEREKGQLQKKLRRLGKELENMQPEHAKHETQVSGLKRRIKGHEEALVQQRAEAEKRVSHLAALESELAQVTTLLASLAKDIVSAEEASVSPESMAEYKALKQSSAVRTAALQQESADATRVAQVATRQKESVSSELDAAKARVQELENSVAAYEDQLNSLVKIKTEAEEELQSLEAEHERSAEVSVEREQIRARLERTVNDTTQALRDAKADLSENNHRRKFDTALENMARLFPGVKGRLSDLCKPTQDRYREAVAVLFGKLMDAIVVDTQRTGSECIKYLKEQEIGMATFIPLADVRPRPVDEGLRRLGGTAKLVVDVVAHETNVSEAVHYAAGNAVVCDTLDEARAIRYGGGRNIKICSLDGTLINKAGFMTGGGNRSNDRAGKWDRAEIDALKKKRTLAKNELNTMGPAATDRRVGAERAERIDGLRRKIAILEQDRRDTRASLDRTKTEKQVLSSEVEKLTPQLVAASEAADTAQGKVTVLARKTAGLENEMFGDFAERNEVSSVKEFEDNFIGRSASLRGKQLEAETRQSRLMSLVNYEQSKGQNKAISRLEQRIAEQTARLEEAEMNLDNLESKRCEIQDRVDKIQDQIKTIGTDHEEKKDALKEARQEFAKEAEAVSDCKKSVELKKNSLRSLQSRREFLLSDSQVNRVVIPLKGGGKLGGDSLDVEETADANQSADSDAEMKDVEDTDGNDDVPRQEEDFSNVVLDFSCLTRRMRNMTTSEAQKEAVGKMDADVEGWESQLSQLAPNMRAKDHMDDVASRLTALDKEAEVAKEKAKDAADLFESLKEDRQDRFMACFNHVAEKISEVYRDMTKSNVYPMGGTAYLSLEQQDEAFLGGIKFNAMPPTKRFRDMDQLSGGERTVAALALLFACHDFQPSPFFILDEVDAALDSGNVAKVSAYVQSRAPELQTIVISHKDVLFEKADALVGIYRDDAINSSRILTLDLSVY